SPSYPGGPAQQYPAQPPAPPAPAGPYAQPQPAPGLDWGQAQSGAYASPMPSQPSYAQPGYPQPAESYGQVPGYPTPDPYAVPGAAASAPAAPAHVPTHAAPAAPVAYPPGSGVYQQQPPAPPYQQQQQQQPQQGVSYPSYAPPPQPPSYPAEPSYPAYTPQPPQPQQAQPPQPPQPPQPIAYPQPPFPQAPGGPPIAAPAGGSARPNNAFALTGALTSIVPVVGLVFSIIGLAKAKLLGGIGRRVAVLGVTLSLVFSVAWGAAGVYILRVADSHGADPGCVAAIGDYLTYSQELGTDAEAMGKTSYGTKQFTAAVKAYESDLQVLIGRFQADAAQAGHTDARTSITSLVGDLQQLKTMMGDLETGNFSDVGSLGDISTLNGKLLSDYQHTQSICSGYAHG
ncbi:hypothetical protein KDL01_12680, partial [Actinospica durhamensis]|nr:hypothetical protein [Actinospica durhamensis]